MGLSERIAELEKLKSDGRISEDEFRLLVSVALKDVSETEKVVATPSIIPESKSSIKSNKVGLIAVVLIVLAVVAFKVMQPSSSPPNKSDRGSTTDVYAERIKYFTKALGKTESEVISYATACGIDLSDIQVPFSYVSSVLIPLLTSDQMAQANRDALSSNLKPRCLYAQGG